MGNYLSSLPYIKSGYLPENNNAINENIAEKMDQPRLAPKIFHYFTSVDVPSVLASKRLQNQYKKDSSTMLNLWQRLDSLFQYRYATPEINITEENSQSNSFEENSFSEKTSLTNFDKQTCRPLCERDLEVQESGDLVSLRIKTKLQSPVDCFKRSQERTLGFDKLIFQRLDSGIEDTPFAFSARTQIDVDALYFRTRVTMADNQECCSIDSTLKSEMVYNKSICFFIDISDPLRQMPLCEDYRFSTFGECDSMFSYDSMFSDKSSGNSNDNCADDDFIVFEEDTLDDDAAYDFNLILKNPCTPTKLSCCVGANSTTCLDICLNTSPITPHSMCPRKLITESSMSVKIDISPNTNSKSHESDALNHESYKAEGCLDSNCCSTSQVTSDKPYPEKTYPIELQTTNCFDAFVTTEKSAKLKVNVSSNTDCCVVTGKTTGKKKSRKKVCFERDDDLVVVYEMRHWDFAYREARKGHWELAAADRCRFRRRIQELELILTPCLKRKLGLIEKT
ncbi:uncharacterized protein LOC114542382 [Dendronephthya gigantea]|uniref:uncharacterized protein LOC114542382 n=1 Tax=Dendronephthya gigantea TaxID=151771 RepID=UPI00106CB48D|nr:uncharacterized protein LOC114542382 [Dendronephthya gigantea]